MGRRDEATGLDRTEHAERSARLNELRELRRKGGDLDALIDAVSSPALTGLRDQQMALMHQEAELLTSFGARHPRLIAVRYDKNPRDVVREQ